jgi:hypothetical protein
MQKPRTVSKNPPSIQKIQEIYTGFGYCGFEITPFYANPEFMQASQFGAWKCTGSRVVQPVSVDSQTDRKCQVRILVGSADRALYVCGHEVGWSSWPQREWG